jgi:hypothetical protein
MKSPVFAAGSESPGIRLRVCPRICQTRFFMATASSLMKKHIPRANHIPARVAMNGWTFRKAIKLPMIAPSAIPISSMTRITAHSGE